MSYKGEPKLKDVLDALQNSIFRQLHSSSLGIVTEIKTQTFSKEETFMCRLIPTATNNVAQTIECHAVNDRHSYAIGDEVVIMFMDDDFRTNQKQINQKLELSNNSEQSEKHSLSYGIIICKVNNTITRMPTIALGSDSYREGLPYIDDDTTFKINVKIVDEKPLPGDILQLVYKHSSISNRGKGRKRIRFKVFAQTIISGDETEPVYHIHITKDIAAYICRHTRVGDKASRAFNGIRHCYVRLTRPIYGKRTGNRVDARHSNYIPIMVKIHDIEERYFVETM